MSIPDNDTYRALFNLYVKAMKEKSRMPILHYAVENGTLAMVATLLDLEETNPNEPDELGRTALHFAIMKGDQAKVMILLKAGAELGKAGAELNQPDGLGRTALHRTVMDGKDRVVAALIEAGANPNEPNKRGATPLHVAVIEGNQEMVDVLLKAGADPDAPNKEGKTPKDLVLRYGITIARGEN